MEDWKYYWQDVVAVLAGVWLITTVCVGITTITVATGWLAYTAGAMITAMAAGGFQDETPYLSWGVAAFGLLATATPFIAGITGEPLAMWSVLAAGAITTPVAIWSALVKSGVSAEEPTRAPARAPAE